MGLLDEISGVLNHYGGTSGTNPERDVENDFGRVAQQVPQSSLASGISNVFRSNQTPPFGQMVSQMFGQSNGQQRVGILNQLIASAGASALPGALSGMLGGSNTITPEQAQQVTPAQVQSLAEQAHQQDPSIVDRAGEFYAQHPTLVQGLGAGALALLMSHLSQR